MPSHPESTRTDPEALIAALAEDARRRAAGAGAGAGAGASAAGVAEAGGTRWPEPDPDQLLDYLEGRLPPEEAAKLERRLVADPAAARALADLAELSSAETAEPAAAAGLAVHAGWRDFEKRRLGGDRKRRRGGRWTPWLVGFAAAASLAAVVLGARVSTLQRELGRPVPVMASLDLHAGTRAGGLEPEEVEVAEGARLLVTFEPEPCDSYRARIVPEAGGGEVAVPGLARDAQGLVMFHWPPAPGVYELTLTGCDPPRELESHRIRIVRPRPTSGDGG